MSTIGFPNSIPIELGAVPVYVQDQTTDIIDLHLTRFIDDITLTQDTALDATTIYVSCNTTPVAGQTICLKESYAFYQGKILTVTPTGGTNYTLVIGSPLDYPYTTAGGCSLNDDRMNVDGSVTPVIFRLSPSGLTDPFSPSLSQQWDVTRIMLYIRDDAAMDDSRFGSIIGGVTNGVLLRKKNGTYKNIFNARTNGDLALHAYDVTYIDSTLPPAGFYSMRVRRSFAGPEKNGVTIRLDAAGDDELQLIVRDNLTSQSEFYAVAQGHVVIKETDWTQQSTPLIEDQWVKVVDNKRHGAVYMQGNYFNESRAYFAFVPTGSAAPTISPGQSGSTAIEMKNEYLPFSNPVSIDIYMWAPESGAVAVAYTK